jgi:molybdopterin-guanine dinucleotide biosynthesis protein B
MSAPRAVSIVGFKAAGKTTVVEEIIHELTRRGHRVVTIKHTGEDQSHVTPGTDTFRHAQAGAYASAILSESFSTFFLQRNLSINEAASILGEADFLILEGFKTQHICPRILVPRKISEVDSLLDGLEIAIADPKSEIPTSGLVPIIRDPSKLTDLIIEKAHPLLAGLDCASCGHSSCRDMSFAILHGEADSSQCIKYRDRRTSIRVDGNDITLNPFTEKLTRNILLGLVGSMKGIDHPHRIEVKTDE